MLQVETSAGQRIEVKPTGCPRRAMQRIARVGVGYETEGREVWLPPHAIARIVQSDEPAGNCLVGVCPEDDTLPATHAATAPATATPEPRRSRLFSFLRQ